MNCAVTRWAAASRSTGLSCTCSVLWGLYFNSVLYAFDSRDWLLKAERASITKPFSSFSLVLLQQGAPSANSPSLNNTQKLTATCKFCLSNTIYGYLEMNIHLFFCLYFESKYFLIFIWSPGDGTMIDTLNFKSQTLHTTIQFKGRGFVSDNLVTVCWESFLILPLQSSRGWSYFGICL